MLAAAGALSLLPFALVHLPSMTDLPGHIGRYAVMADEGRSVWLARYYAVDWRLVGNLGVDLLVRLFAPLVGVERAALVVVAGIAPLTIAGVAAVSRAAHRRVEPAALLACCFVLSNPLLFGFVNYCLSFALALLAFAAWIALRERAAWVQFLAMVPLVFVTWLAHAMGWGVLALLVAGWEGGRWVERRQWRDPAIRLLAFVPPALLTFLWGGGGNGALFAYGDHLASRKLMNWIVVLRGSERWIDLATPVVVGVIVAVLLWRGSLRLHRGMAVGAALLALACCVLPTTLFGSWGADERLAPAAVIAALLSLRWSGGRRGAVTLAAIGLALFTARTAVLAASWQRLDRDYAADLHALDHVPPGTRIHAIVLQDECHAPWRATAYNHLAALAIGRRQALVNTEWELPGAALLKVRRRIPGLSNDPSQMVTGYDCAGPVAGPLAARLHVLSPADWDFVWILQTKGRDRWPGRAPAYRSGQGALYPLRRR